ncbi:unnamed protein product [Mytilus coruscus]|uniref:Uncharacterized protein n=1 Tax=Mytilus coruscus TaxID=42192 RepID=A0A6J8BWJ4_MYTCO|nr:unnamed protein product [Mytilus coruscus]
MDKYPLGSILFCLYLPIQVLTVHEYTKCSNASVSENLPVATFCTNSEAEGVRIVLDGYFAHTISDKGCSCVAQRGQAQKIVFSNVNFLQSPIQGGDWCGSKIIAKQDNGQSNHMSCRVLGTLALQDDNHIQISLRKESLPEDTRYCALVYFDTDEPIKISCFSNNVTTTSVDETNIITTTNPSTMISSYLAETKTVEMFKETSSTLTSQHVTVTNSIIMNTINPPVSTTYMDPYTATKILLTENATVVMETTETTISVDTSIKDSTKLTDVQSDTTSLTSKAFQTNSSKIIDVITTTEPGTSREISIQMTEMTPVQSTPFTVDYISSTEISTGLSTRSNPSKTTASLTTQNYFNTKINTITPAESKVSTNVSLDITGSIKDRPTVSVTTDTGIAKSSTSAVNESTKNQITPYTHLFSATTESTEATDTSIFFETTTTKSTSTKESLETTLPILQLSSNTTTEVITVTKTQKGTDSDVDVIVSTVEGLRTTDLSKTESSSNTSTALITQESTMTVRRTTKINTTVPPEPTTTIVTEQTADDKNLYIGIGVGCGALVIITIILIGAKIRKKHLTSKGIELKSYEHGEENDYTTVNVTQTSTNNQTNGINYTNGTDDMSSKHKPECTESDEYNISAAKQDVPNIKLVDSLYAVVDKSKKEQSTDSVNSDVKDHTAAEETHKTFEEPEATAPDTANNGLQYAELEFSHQPSTTDGPNVTHKDSVDYAEVMFKN